MSRNDLHSSLCDIDLEQYTETFRAAGFRDWATLATITESELAALDIARGHRRRLQREIARRRGWPEDQALPEYVFSFQFSSGAGKGRGGEEGREGEGRGRERKEKELMS